MSMRIRPSVAVGTLGFVLAAVAGCGGNGANVPPPTASLEASPSPSAAPISPTAISIVGASGWWAEINGILVGPGAPPTHSERCNYDAEYVDAAETEGTELEIDPAYLPEGATETSQLAEVVACGGVVVWNLRYYVVPDVPDPVNPLPLRSGGGFNISRVLTGTRSFSFYSAAADRTEPVTISGRPAVFMRPFVANERDIGFFEGALVIAEPWGMTAIYGTGLTTEEFIKVAEGLYREAN